MSSIRPARRREDLAKVKKGGEAHRQMGSWWRWPGVKRLFLRAVPWGYNGRVGAATGSSVEEAAARRRHLQTCSAGHRARLSHTVVKALGVFSFLRACRPRAISMCCSASGLAGRSVLRARRPCCSFICISSQVFLTPHVRDRCDACAVVGGPHSRGSWGCLFHHLLTQQLKVGVMDKPWNPWERSRRWPKLLDIG